MKKRRLAQRVVPTALYVKVKQELSVMHALYRAARLRLRQERVPFDDRAVIDAWRSRMRGAGRYLEKRKRREIASLPIFKKDG